MAGCFNLLSVNSIQRRVEYDRRGPAQTGGVVLKWPDDFINKVICGDCLSVLPLIPDGAVDAVITDPPYNVDKADWDSIDLAPVLYQVGRVMKAGASIYIFSSLRHLKDLLNIVSPLFEQLNLCIWLFPNGMNRQIDNWQICYDPVYFGKKTGQHKFNTDDVRFAYTAGTQERIKNPVVKGGKEWKPHADGRKPENVLVVPCLNHGAGAGERTEHPTQKPIDLMKMYVSASSDPNDLILDPFLGSGTTAVAAKQLGRQFIGIEIEEKYCKIAVDRLRQEELF